MMSQLSEPETETAKFDGGGESSLEQTKATSPMCEIKEVKNNVLLLTQEPRQKENSIQILLTHLSEMEQKKVNLHKELEKLHQRIDTSNCTDIIKKLTTKLEILKALEWEDSDLRPSHDKAQPSLPSDLELEMKVSPVNGGHVNTINFDQAVSVSLHKLDLAKKKLAAKLRAILSLKRQYDDVPAQTELIQYECRFSELYTQIQEKHRKTRKHYATYNALLEIKELMLKETSLLNSIDSQFQDAMSSITSRSKLVDSMEVIIRGTKQRLEKVQHTFLAEQRICDSLKDRQSTAVAEQRHFSSLLKAFQEECTRNEKLRRLTSI